jgi:hypothetical protein
VPDAGGAHSLASTVAKITRKIIVTWFQASTLTEASSWGTIP